MISENLILKCCLSRISLRVLGNIGIQSLSDILSSISMPWRSNVRTNILMSFYAFFTFFLLFLDLFENLLRYELWRKTCLRIQCCYHWWQRFCWRMARIAWKSQHWDWYGTFNFRWRRSRIRWTIVIGTCVARGNYAQSRRWDMLRRLHLRYKLNLIRWWRS